MKHLKLHSKSRQNRNVRKYDESADTWLQCARLDLLQEKDICTALDQISINPNDGECRSLIQQRIRNAVIQDTLNPRAFEKANRAASGVVTGPIRLGIINHTNEQYGIHMSSLRAHVVVFGRTDGGKSSFVRLILQQLLN